MYTNDKERGLTMYKLYENTINELIYEKDYKRIPDLDTLNATQVIELRENLYNAIENAFLYGAALLEQALYTDIVTVQRYICTQYIKTVSCGHMASVIGSSKYDDIYKACDKAWVYFTTECTDEELYNIGTDPKEIENLILKAYRQ